MRSFVIRRVVWTIPVILLVILITFSMMKQIGGNPFRATQRAVPPAIQKNLDETVFAIPGIGRAHITAVGARDYSVVMGITVLVSLIVIVANLVVDILSATVANHGPG